MPMPQLIINPFQPSMKPIPPVAGSVSVTGNPGGTAVKPLANVQCFGMYVQCASQVDAGGASNGAILVLVAGTPALELQPGQGEFFPCRISDDITVLRLVNGTAAWVRVIPFQVREQ